MSKTDTPDCIAGLPPCAMTVGDYQCMTILTPHEDDQTWRQGAWLLRHFTDHSGNQSSESVYFSANECAAMAEMFYEASIAAKLADVQPAGAC